MNSDGPAEQGIAAGSGLDDLITSLLEDQARRWRAGDRVRLEDYLARHPALRDDPDAMLALVFNEVGVREELGESPSADEYIARFPGLAREVAEQFEVHRTLRATPGPSAGTQPASAGSTGARSGTGGGEPSWPEVPGYEIQGMLGRGGMGVVYRAFDRARGIPVALKTIKHENPGAILRFKHEFRSLVEVVHPNLVKLYELLFDGNGWYIAMELIEGVDFLSHVRGEGALAAKSGGSGMSTTVEASPDPSRGRAGPNPPPRQVGDADPISSAGRRRLRDGILQLAQGVAAIHQAGKLHRDLKPANVLVTPSGRVVVLDFGLAAEMGQPRRAEVFGSQVSGTAGYMAPEQAARLKMSPSSDWYSVGVMLYEALTGRLPFLGSGLEVMMDKQRYDPPPPRELVCGLPDDLATLCTDLLRRDPEARPKQPEILRRLGAADVPSTTSLVSSSHDSQPLVGRARHRQFLEEGLAAVAEGRTVVMQVHGPSGVGKSALVQRFLADLVEGDRAVVLSGRCYQQETVPYKALDAAIDTLAHYLTGLDAAEVRALLPRDVGSLARVFPVLRRVGAVAEAPRRSAQIPDPQELRRRAFSAMRELLARLGDQRPIVIAVDDAQWGDLDSATLLGEILRPSDPPFLLLLASYRREDRETSPFVVCLNGPEGRPEGPVERRELSVDPLTAAEARELAMALLGGDGPSDWTRAEEVARESGGNPFFVAELSRRARVEAPSQRAGETGELVLEDVLWDRVRALPEESRRLLEVVAVSGRPIRVTDASRCVESLSDGRSAIALLRSGRLIRGVPGSEEEVETYHDRVRETVLARLPADVTREHHRKLALALQAVGHSDPEVIGSHFREAGDVATAGAYFAKAAARAAEMLAFDRAARFYRLALESPPHEASEAHRLRTALGDALANAGRGSEAARVYLDATQGATVAEALELRGRAAQQYLISGHIDEGLETLRSVLTAVGLRLPSSPWQSLLSYLFRELLLRIRGLGFRSRDPSQVSAAELTRIDICWSAATGLSVVDTVRGADFQARGLLLALRAGERSRIARSLAWEAGHNATRGVSTHDRTVRLLEAAEATAREVGDSYSHGMVLMARGLTNFLEGDWSEAHKYCEQAAGLFREQCSGVHWERYTANLFNLWALNHLGEIAEFSRRWPQLLAEARDRGDLYSVMNLSSYMLTVVRLADDEPDRAREEIGQAMAAWSRGGYHVQHNEQVWGTAHIELYTGRARAAFDLVQWSWPALSRSMLLNVQFIRVGMVQLRARCALAAAVDCDEPEPILRIATSDARRLEKESTPWAVASARLVLASLAHVRGDRETTVKLLRDAADRFDKIPMTLCAEAVKRRLGVILGGDAGEALVARADAWMKEQGIRRPDRITDVYAPGFNARLGSASSADVTGHPA
jgi:serine/threonine protein kinase/tetratricopeptide (TPR) repeat protein